MTENNKTGKVDLLAKYRAKMEEQLQGKAGPFLFRGQEDAVWPLQSSAAYRIRKSWGFSAEQPLPLIPTKTFLKYHENLLETVRKRGWGKGANGERLSDLALLAKLRHLGAAVFLLDFTSRLDVALWFACQGGTGTGAGNKKSKNGRIFIVENPQTGLGEVRSDEIGKLISYFFHPEARKTEDGEKAKPTRKNASKRPKTPDEKIQFWYWEPEILLDRMLSQESRFFFGPRDVPEGKYSSIVIEEQDKEGILEELRRQQNLRSESVFADIHGFAAANTRGAFWKDKFGKSELHGAVADFDEEVRLHPDLAAAWYSRGIAKQRAVAPNGAIDPDDAIADFDEAIRLQPDFKAAWSNRGKTKSRMAQGRISYHDGAIADLSEAIRLDPSDAAAWNDRGDAKEYKWYFCLDTADLDSAIADFDEAIRLQPDFAEAWCNRAKTKISKRDYDGAITDCDRAIHLDPHYALAWSHRILAKNHKGDHQGSHADFEEANRLLSD